MTGGYSSPAEILLATAYGIEGIDRYRTGEYDPWLDLFDTALDELERPSLGSPRRTLAEDFFPDQEERAAVIRKYEELDALAAAIKATPADERPATFPDERIDTAIADAEELYALLDDHRPV